MMAKKIVLQLFLWCYFLYQLGCFVSIMGPTLPDLQDHFQASLAEISYLFLALGFALSAGCILSMIVLKFLDSNLAVAVSLLLGAATIPLVALTPHLSVGCAAVCVAGVCLACAFTCVCHLCSVTFPDNPSIMHGMLISTSVGGITAPLIAAPFLVQRNNSADISTPSVEDNIMTETDQHLNPSGGLLHSLQLFPLLQNSTALRRNFMSFNLNSQLLFKNDTNFTTPTIDTFGSDVIHVHLVYIIIGIALLPPAIGFMVLFILQRKCSFANPSQAVTSTYVPLNERGKKGKWILYLFLTLLVVTYIPFCGIPFSYNAFLTTYGVESNLNISVQKMVEITSCFWLTYFVGRIIGTVISLYMKQSTLMLICLIGTLLSAILVTVIGPLNEACLWVGTMPLGLFTAPLLAASMSWCKSCVPMTPLVMGVCTLGDATGAAILPYITGQIIASFGLDWYLYSIIIWAAFQLVAFGILAALGQMLKTGV